MLSGPLSEECGYFRFGPKAICYGASASGHLAERPDEALYDCSNETVIQNTTVSLSFDPEQAVNSLRLELYAKRFRLDSLDITTRGLRNLYYSLRPVMHANIRRKIKKFRLTDWRGVAFPSWPVDTTVEDLNEQVLLLSMKAAGINRMPFIWFWPDGARSSVIVTHDVEERAGLEFCAELMAIDDRFNIKASFQLVPEGRYRLSDDVVGAIRDRGFEVNIQDLNHDGQLFRSKDEFLRRAERINHYGELYGAKGFRAGVLYRNQEWFDALKFSYDMSVPNVAHLDPQRGGCCTVMPYFIGDILELPVTTTQDYMLFHLLEDYSLDLWKKQIEIILKKNGLISFIIHPDYMIEQKARSVYESLLEHLQQLRSEKKLWFAVPGEVDQWWRQRSQMQLVEQDGRWCIEGPGSERARVAFAKVAGDQLEYEVASGCGSCPAPPSEFSSH